MLHARGLGESELSVLLCDDTTMRRLNRRYRGIDKTTDVLAFSLREGPGAQHVGPMLGDVVLCIPQARRQARAAGRSLREELTELLAHGLLHLCGMDHRTAAEDRRMRRETRRLLEAVGTARSLLLSPGPGSIATAELQIAPSDGSASAAGPRSVENSAIGARKSIGRCNLGLHSRARRA